MQEKAMPLLGTFRLRFLSITGTVVAYILALYLNDSIFTHAEFVRGVNWIYLPTGIRLLSTLLVGVDGFWGLLIAGLIVDFVYYFPHDPVRGIAGSVIGAVGPYLVYRLALERYNLKASLTNLTPRRLLVLALAVATVNSTLLHIWFALTGDTRNFIKSFCAMYIGDLSGALIVLYVMKGLLSLLPAQARRA
jgi:hypothetical protein